jgi:hypothetical protein
VVHAVEADGSLTVRFDDGATVPLIEQSDAQPKEVFDAHTFIVTGDFGSEARRAQLEEQIKKGGGRLVELKGLVEEFPASGARSELQAAHEQGLVVMLGDAKRGTKIKPTLKLLFGLALGLRPLRPSWLDNCLKGGRRLEPAAAHHVPVHDRVKAAAPATSKPLAEYRRQIVLLGKSEWRKTWGSLLRAAGAEVHREIASYL